MNENFNFIKMKSLKEENKFISILLFNNNLKYIFQMNIKDFCFKKIFKD